MSCKLINLIQKVFFSEAEDDDKVMIPILSSDSFAFFSWPVNTGIEHFLKRYCICSHSSKPYTSQKFQYKKFDEEIADMSEIEIGFYKVKDNNNNLYYLGYIDFFNSFDCLENCFCIPQHLWNIHQVYKEYSKTYDMMEVSL